jgi:hypothetical protein
VPETWLVPHKQPPDNPRFPYTAQKYNKPFDLRDVAAKVGYPLWMKPYDGGAWVGVSRIKDEADLIRAYDESGQRLMHLQASVEGFDVFARSLSIGAETMVMRFSPDRPQHDRYSVSHEFLDAATGEEVVTIGKVVNAFFKWEFNSCETLVRGGQVHPIDYANACPDVSLTSLHYYFPWAMTSLVKWSLFCTATGRLPRVDLDTRRWYDVADSEASYEDKLGAYRRMADDYFEQDRYAEFVQTQLRDLDAVAHDYFASADFDALLVETVRATFPAHEHEQFVAHYRGLFGAWVADAARAG